MYLYIVLYFFKVPGRYVLFAGEILLSKCSCSAAIGSWKDFRPIAPTYFFMGNPFPIDLRVFEHSIDRLHDPYVARFNRELAVIQ